MNEPTDKFASLDTAEYLYLRGISEPRDNAVRVIVQEATVNRAKTNSLELPGLSDYRQIFPHLSKVASTGAYRPKYWRPFRASSTLQNHMPEPHYRCCLDQGSGDRNP
jgi:hypothetical protein